MTLNEFKAWLDGYEESFTDGVPNAEQYGKITDRLKTVTLIQPVAQQKPPVSQVAAWPWQGQQDLNKHYLPRQ